MGDASIKVSTMIYVPKIQYPTGFDTNVSEGDIKKEEEQYILIKIHKDGFHRVQISRKSS